MNHFVPKRQLVYSPAFRAQIAARRRGRQLDAMNRKLKVHLVDRRDSLITLIDAKQAQLEEHVAEFDAIEAQLAELEGRST